MIIRLAARQPQQTASKTPLKEMERKDDMGNLIFMRDIYRAQMNEVIIPI